MRNVLILVLLMTVVLVAVGVVVFRYSLGLSWDESVYFVITTVTTVGYGDINLRDASPGVRLFGIFLMLAGAASMAATFGIVTDLLLRVRLQEFLGLRKRPMHNHIVLCGLGNLGFRVLEHLHKLGEDVVVVEKSADNKFLDEARAMNVPVIVGDIRIDSTLRNADIAQAKCLVAATDDDLANLAAALTAREARSDIQVVLRMFDQNLAKKVRDGFGIRTAFSTSALAAPAFAMAALDSSVIGSFYIGSELMLNVELAVRKGTQLAKMTTAELSQQGAAQVLAYTSVATGQRQLYPSKSQEIRAGDVLVVSTVPDFLPRLEEMNTATQTGQT